MRRCSLLLLTIGLLSSCYLPPYREELSLALPTARQMELTAEVGPIDRRPWDFEGRDIVFYPSKDALRIRTLKIVRGFIVATDERSARLMFVDHGSTESDDYYIGSENTFPLENSDDTEFVFRATTLKDDADDIPGVETLGIIAFDNIAGLREYLIFDQYLSPVYYDLNAAYLTLGAGFFPNSTPTSDLFYVLGIDASALYMEEEYDGDTGIPTGSADDRGPSNLPGLPDGMTNGFYSLYVPTNRAYFSVYDGARRTYRNFSWDTGLQLKILADMDRRIDLVLTNGWLFSQDGNKGYVYDGDGDLINVFVMGGLTLVYEIFDGAINRVVFTIPNWTPVRVGDNDWEDKLLFLVYWIPTERLGDL
jgi:hypothetical protein